MRLAVVDSTLPRASDNGSELVHKAAPAAANRTRLLGVSGRAEILEECAGENRGLTAPRRRFVGAHGSKNRALHS